MLVVDVVVVCYKCSLVCYLVVDVTGSGGVERLATIERKTKKTKRGGT